MTRAPNPWDRPALSADARLSKRDDLYLAIGKAAMSWASVEQGLSMLFSGIFLGTAGYAAYKMYSTFPSTSSRRMALAEAGAALFVGDDVRGGYLKGALTLVEKFQARRNDIVHGIIVSPINDGEQAYLTAPQYTQKLADSHKEPYRFNAEHITDYGKKFHALFLELVHCRALLFDFGKQGLPETPLSHYLKKYKDALQNPP